MLAIRCVPTGKARVQPPVSSSSLVPRSPSPLVPTASQSVSPSSRTLTASTRSNERPRICLHTENNTPRHLLQRHYGF